MKRTAHPAPRGFTLVELLVVISLIGIISGMAVALMSGATEKSAATVSMAIQKDLTNQINAYMALHDQTMPNKFDSLLRTGYPTDTGSWTDLDSSSTTIAGVTTQNDFFVATSPAAFILQDVPASANTMPQNVNRGVDTAAYSGDTRTLTVYKLKDLDVSALKGIGATLVNEIAQADRFHGGFSYTARTLATNQPICIIDPQSLAGQQVYKDFGIDLSDAAAYPKDAATGELTADARLAAFKKQLFFVVGLGPNCTMIGDQSAGVQEAPTCGLVGKGFYNTFLVVIKKNMSPYDQTPAFAGILDAKGRGPTAARMAVNSVR